VLVTGLKKISCYRRRGDEFQKLIDLTTYIGVKGGVEHGFLLKFWDF
jgi:hypothetical protein